MGSRVTRVTRVIREEQIEEMKQETGFSHSQVTGLHSRFTSLDKGENGTLSREDFQRIPELAINQLGDRIINTFFPNGQLPSADMALVQDQLRDQLEQQQQQQQLGQAKQQQAKQEAPSDAEHLNRT